MDFPEALAYLDSHINLEATPMGRRDAPTLDRIAALCSLMGEPQMSYPVIHVTGTNGKGSTVRMISSLLGAQGLSVGTYTSPHLQSITERIVWNGQPIGEEELAEVLSALADLEDLMDAKAHWFDLLTAAAFRWFADQAVDVAVVEVGLGGTWDATNVVRPAVAVITNIDLDHVQVLGPTRTDIARDKAGIFKADAELVVGERDPALFPLFEKAALDAGAGQLRWRGRDFEVVANRTAVGGRSVSVRTPLGFYEDMMLPLHGAHQADNLACALVACESFFSAPLSEDVVAQGLGSLRNPGRMEVVGRRPLVVLDGAHNPAGARAAAATLAEDFAVEGGRILVVGLLRGKDPEEMLRALRADSARVLVVTESEFRRALPAEEVAEAARRLGLANVEVVRPVPQALERARRLAGEDDLIFISGTLYVVGEARTALAGA